MSNPTPWPPLPYADWQDTLNTLHLWLQVVGKVKLKLNPFLNHWWEVAFYVTPRGLATGRIPYKDLAFEIIFDFVSHRVIIFSSGGKKLVIPLRSYSVADFYKIFFQALHSLGITVAITPYPSEIPHAVPFQADFLHAAYDKNYAARWWRILLRTSFIFDRFRTGFRGKSSPVHFFWGTFDLNTARFSGRHLPDKTDWPKGFGFMRYAENEANFSCGFWPGDEKFSQPAFYSYIYPVPPGLENIQVKPDVAFYNHKLSEFILPYQLLRLEKQPEEKILTFLKTTYEGSARLAGWNINDLQGPIPHQ
jgi:hypothetical protein